jgi:cyanophycinase-like exopeptidase
MPQLNIFRWQAGKGWIVLSGGGSCESEGNLDIETKLLSRTVSQGPLAYIWAASDVETADHHMDCLRELGARTGYLIDILTEQDDILFQQLSEAGVIILGGGPRGAVLREALPGVVLRGLQEAFRRGATIYAAGSSSMAFGSHFVDGDESFQGVGWLAQAIILPGYTPEHADLLRDWVQQHPDSYGLGLGEGAALALGPRGEVEIWGNPAVTVSLGQHYQPSTDE